MLTFQGLSGKAAQDMEIRLEVRSPDFAYYLFGFSGGSVVKNPPANAGDVNSLPGLGRSSGEGNGNPFQYSCLENTMGIGAWQATVLGVTRVRYDLVTKPPPPKPHWETFYFLHLSKSILES